jgi:imidazolonepropionase-like amidohydrolase
MLTPGFGFGLGSHGLPARVGAGGILYLLLCGLIACSASNELPDGAEDVMWFEGARLIVGDGSAPIENSAFLVEEDTFTWVGRQGEAEPPEGAVLVNLSGHTVIPALIDAHQHIGLPNVKAGTNRTENYTRDNLVDHLERTAYHGGAATMSLGLEFDEPLAFQLRNEVVPNAALFLTSGRGIAATPEGGPQSEHLLGIPRGAIDEKEGRAAVRELHSHGVTLVKIWVDGRSGSVPKIAPDVYRAIIDEAHANAMDVVAHLGRTNALADAKDLLRAGIDGFSHTVRDRDVDEEYLGLVRQHPDAWTIPNLPGALPTMDDLSWLSETLPPLEIERMRKQIQVRQDDGDPEQAAFFALQCRNLAKHHEAGMMIGMGTDSGGVTVPFSVGWPAHTEMRDMVTCGLSPMDAIMSATHVNAEILGLDGLGLVAEGKSASFVVLDANPLDDINNTRRISQVYLRGAEVGRAALRAKFMDGVR